MKVLIILLLLMASGCGYASRGNILVGQAKRLVHLTPIVCDDRIDGDVSFGVMRNGAGSVSKKDLWVTIPNAADQKTFNDAASQGGLVELTYDVKRFTWCWCDHIVTSVKVVQ